MRHERPPPEEAICCVIIPQRHVSIVMLLNNSIPPTQRGRREFAGDLLQTSSNDAESIREEYAATLP
jgi:hypothetical protein